MNFQNIEPINSATFYLDVAIQKGKKYANNLSIQIKDDDKKTFIKESARIKVVKDILVKHLNNIISSFPSIDGLPEFYYELCLNSMDVDELKQSLSAISWAPKKINELEREFLSKSRGRSKSEILHAKKSFFGRVSSIMKRMNNKFDMLEDARRIMITFPDIKDDLYTVCIAGFPNVGKSTLLTKITSSKPEIGSYAFTTKSLNTGYFKFNFESIQIVDVPGSLNRFDKMNNVEKQAFLAIRYIADLVVYVYDLTEPYSIEEQNALFANTSSLGKDVIIYFSKVDLLGEETIIKFIEEHNINDAVFDSEQLKLKIVSMKKKN